MLTQLPNKPVSFLLAFALKGAACSEANPHGEVTESTRPSL